MSNYDATAYYVGHYGKASAEDWVRWHQDGTWPSKRDLQSPTDFPIGDGHGVVYHMLAQQRQLNRVLDIGCSAGNFLLPITKICREAHGVDIAPFLEHGTYFVITIMFTAKSLISTKATCRFQTDIFQQSR